MAPLSPLPAAYPESSSDLDSEFRALTEKIASFYAKHGAAVKPYHDPSLVHFSKLSPERKANALHYLRLIWGITQDHEANEIEAGNDAKSLWSALKVCRLKPGNELFSHLEADDKIEVYSLGGIQVWRNCNVMDICSYTLEEIHSFDWQERYERDPEDTAAIMAAIEEITRPGGARMLYAKIPFHEVKERFSEQRYRLNMRHDYFFPLYGENQEVTAFVVTSKVNVLASEAEAPPPRRTGRLALVAPLA